MMGFNDHFPGDAHALHEPVGGARRTCFRSRACALLFDRATRSDPDAPPAPPKIASRYVPDVSPDEYRDRW